MFVEARKLVGGVRRGRGGSLCNEWKKSSKSL